MTSKGVQDPVASVVIPAHNEAGVIDKCLSALQRASMGGRLEIIVVANGCSDDTAEVAAKHPGVQVLLLDKASKTDALNSGDGVATAFPRLYVDADVELTPAAVDSLVSVLSVPLARVSAPSVLYITDGASWPVRSYYRFFARLPSAVDGIAGHGVYALSAAGRERFGTFPPLLGDDLFVERHFRPEEKVRAEGVSLVRTPRDLRSLIKVRTRIARGNAQLAASDGAGSARYSRTTGATLRCALQTLRHRPGEAGDALIFVLVAVAARLRAATAGDGWQRDGSTR